jgi:hypothetical protein
MGFFGNWKRIKETQFFVGSVEEALNRYRPDWTDQSFSYTRKAVHHLLTIQKINAVDEITFAGWAGIAELVEQTMALYERDGHFEQVQSCKFILDACNRYLGRS